MDGRASDGRCARRPRAQSNGASLDQDRERRDRAKCRDAAQKRNPEAERRDQRNRLAGAVRGPPRHVNGADDRSRDERQQRNQHACVAAAGRVQRP